MGAIGASAEVSAPSQADIVAGVQQVTTAVTSQFNIATIASIIGVVLAGCVGLFLFWWGARKVVRMIASAFKKGKISLRRFLGCRGSLWWRLPAIFLEV